MIVLRKGHVDFENFTAIEATVARGKNGRKQNIAQFLPLQQLELLA